MSLFYSIDPTAYGEWGKGTVFVNYNEIKEGKEYLRKLTKLEYSFEHLPVDDIMSSNDCYLVTEELAIALEEANITGIRFERVKISRSLNFKAKYRYMRLPVYRWIQPTGELLIANDHTLISWSGDDFCQAYYPNLDLSRPGPVDVKYHVVVTQKCCDILKLFKLTECEIVPVEFPTEF